MHRCTNVPHKGCCWWHCAHRPLSPKSNWATGPKSSDHLPTIHSTMPTRTCPLNSTSTLLILPPLRWYSKWAVTMLCMSRKRRESRLLLPKRKHSYTRTNHVHFTPHCIILCMYMRDREDQNGALVYQLISAPHLL